MYKLYSWQLNWCAHARFCSWRRRSCTMWSSPWSCDDRHGNDPLPDFQREKAPGAQLRPREQPVASSTIQASAPPRLVDEAVSWTPSRRVEGRTALHSINDGWNNLKIISVHILLKDTPTLSKRPSFISLITLLKRCVSCMLFNDCKLSYWPMRAAETDRYTED